MKKVLLSEAIKISVEIDPKDIEGMHKEPEPDVGSSVASLGGKFEEYVRELAGSSQIERSLIETSREVNESLENILEGVSLSNDKRSFNAAAHGLHNVLREWRSFLRAFSDFEKKFKR